MPRLKTSPYWTTSDRETVKLYQGDVLQVLKALPSESVHCVVTSPPYWGLRDYGIDKTMELGSEKNPDCLDWAKGVNCAENDWQSACFVCRMVLVFREVCRVLRNEGTLWLNFGDTYASGNSGGNIGGSIRPKNHPGDKQRMVYSSRKTGLKPGNLVGIPWRVALALQSDGWILRQDIVWCLSGGTTLYVRSQKGDGIMTVKDLYRLDPSTVQLWNGEKWTNILGMSKSSRKGDELEIVLRSGERISCTPNHKFPTSTGQVKEAKNLSVGNCLVSTVLPQPDAPKNPKHVTNDVSWLAGVYLAEGNMEKGKESFSLAGHAKDVERWERVSKVVEEYGGYSTLHVEGNKQYIRVYGRIICAVVRELVSGKTAKDKHLNPIVWRYSNSFLESFMDGYLHGDGSKDGERYRLGFCRNYSLERDIRTACARLGWKLILKP